MTNSTANVYQDGGGHLVIKPIRDAAGNWTSGRIETQRTDFAAPAGGKLRIEASLQQPNVSGAAAAGYWPAFWALGAAARPVGATELAGIGEIDIMEDINGRSSEFATLHCGTAPGRPVQRDHRHRQRRARLRAAARPASTPTRWSTTAASRPSRSAGTSTAPTSSRVNANQVDATTWNNATHHGFFVILNVAIGGGFPAAFGGGPTAATQSGVPMLVDYVAVYTRRRQPRPRRRRPPPPTDAAAGAGATRTARSRPSPSTPSPACRPRRPPTPAAARTSASSPTVTGPQLRRRQLRHRAGAPVQRPGRLRCRRRA